METFLQNLFPRTLLGKLATLQGNLFLEPLLCELDLASLAWKPGLANFAWKPVPRNLAWNPLACEPILSFSWKPVPGNPCLGTLGTCSWEPGVGIVPGNLACEEKMIGNLVLGVAEDPKLTLLGKTFPSKFPGRGSQAGIQEEVPKQG